MQPNNNREEEDSKLRYRQKESAIKSQVDRIKKRTTELQKKRKQMNILFGLGVGGMVVLGIGYLSLKLGFWK
ncbi:hypothetical protein HDV05_003576 [Chytridiales sp. JEL 0842]|nr:hypothetical protein HDV05_003576 [Chytridiales sp. JEL 0842]